MKKVYQLRRDYTTNEKKIRELAKEWKYWKEQEELAREERKRVENELSALLPRFDKGTQHIELEDGVLSVSKQKRIYFSGNPQPILEKYPDAFKVSYTPRLSVLDKILRTHNGDDNLKAYIQERLIVEERFYFKFQEKEDEENV